MTVETWEAVLRTVDGGLKLFSLWMKRRYAKQRAKTEAQLREMAENIDKIARRTLPSQNVGFKLVGVLLVLLALRALQQRIIR